MKQTIKSSNDDLSAIQEADVPNLDYVIYRDVIKSIPQLSLSRQSTYSYFGRQFSPSSLPTALTTWITETIIGDFMPALKSFLEWVQGFMEEHAP